ncbi:hypothetical protein [Paucibacter sp. XJ19-41]|uniref:hypothetical protein n=1 Tax=Paucibacter sp. XJ19-41 TaxID=2927824 RepID=UPI00234AC5D8|nr:hypothetical protein [Paucibacter sp. XJ19-41]MDC6168375.1 hypothetical protein [Paucibacter sp. XJ19-41]
MATIIGALAIPIAALALWVPLHQQTKLTRVANAQALTELAASLNLQLIQDAAVASLWVEGPEKFDDYSKLDQFRYTSLLIWWLLLHENVFIQKESKLLDDMTYQAWQADLRKFIAEHHLWRHWASLKKNLHPDFALYVEGYMSAGAPTLPHGSSSLKI